MITIRARCWWLVRRETRQRQQLFRDKRGNKAIYSDYQQMLQQERPNIVSISTPATCHAEMVIAAAESGVRGIYCEKAMATSLAECDAMIESCRRSGTVLAINHIRRWDDRFRFLQRLVVEEKIGKVQSIQISYGGGCLCRMGSHMSDLALMLGGDEVVGCSGWLSNADEFDPGGVGLFETRDGCGAIAGRWIFCRIVEPGRDIRIRFAGQTPSESELSGRQSDAQRHRRSDRMHRRGGNTEVGWREWQRCL